MSNESQELSRLAAELDGAVSSEQLTNVAAKLRAIAARISEQPETHIPGSLDPSVHAPTRNPSPLHRAPAAIQPLPPEDEPVADEVAAPVTASTSSDKPSPPDPLNLSKKPVRTAADPGPTEPPTGP